ncbi:MAG: ROK family glucokinase [Candidatus Nanopelagicales bacterium]|nr:ROK family glucokinase [Candidatus Nanopelagicales bacterium]MDZ4249781.1 ROK family glucokinase [Candidatus Nanopelagicales bacterium]MDZ7576575.1 ROK family glucokinase [Candidatus Nanopelagicales bacterium]
MLTAGVDIGGTKIAVGVVNTEGEIVASSRKATPVRDPDGVMDVIVELVAELQESHDLEAVGVGCAGLVDATRSKVIFAPNLGWVDEPLRIRIERALGLPTVVENDANAAAWGEFRFGAGRGANDLVMVTVGTGIGGGVILGGKLQRGASGVSGEFGHLRLVPDGRLCGCGRHGCWEAYASGNALVRIARELALERRPEAGILMSLGDGTPEGVQGPDITEAARRGDPVAIEAFEVLGGWLSRGLVEVSTLLDPAAFVIGGGVVEAGDLLLEPTKREFAPQLLARSQRLMPDIIPAELGNAAGIVGAADLARDHGPTPHVLISPKAAAARVEEASKARKAKGGD